METIGDLLSGELLGQLNPEFRDVQWEIPDWAFRPDQWTRAFLRGLSRARLGERVWEVGVGTGLVSLFLSERAEVYCSDYDERCTSLTERNLDRAGILTTVPLKGSWDLLSPPRGQTVPSIDTVVACIPQVTVPSSEELSPDWHAHYYDPKGHTSGLNDLGLGLNENLLVQARDILPREGRAILNLGGRPGLPRLMRMFEDARYRPSVLYSEIIRQDPGTSLVPLALQEELGCEFEFFADPEGAKRIGARGAEGRRRDRESIWHSIYVIEGTLQ